MPAINTQLAEILLKIGAAAQKSGRTAHDIRLVAVSKTQSIEAMHEYISAAQTLGVSIVFGESYVQELKRKRAALAAQYQLHLIGHLQSNKVEEGVKLADAIHSVHSLKLLEGIAAAARRFGKIQPIFLQINIAHDLSRRGFVPGEIEEIVSHAASMTDAVRLDGLMTITPIYEEPEGVRKDYRQMNELREVLRAKGLDNTFYNGRILLSMGMSADYEIAVEEGSDIVRVGASLFGEREHPLI